MPDALRAYLAELTVRDLALISELRLELAPGLTVLTGETGAGKSLLVDALLAVTGARTSAALVREGSERARVEAVVEGTPTAVRDAIAAAGLEGDGPLILSREIAAGRARARIDRQAVPLALLSEIGSALVSVHGQNDQIRLTSSVVQRDILDRWGAHAPLRERVARAYARRRELTDERARLGGDPRERERRLDLLHHEAGEIEGARIRPDEESELAADLRVARGADALTRAAASAHERLAGEGRSARDLLASALGDLRGANELDPRLAGALARLGAMLDEADDVALELARYRDSIDVDTQRLAELELREEQLEHLKRRYGAALPDVLAYLERVRAELAALLAATERLAALDVEEAAAEAELRQACAALHEVRVRASRTLERAVEGRLGSLELPRCRFRVELVADAPGPSGADRVRFLIAPNPGEPAAPLGEIASGGELSRIMLALEVTLATHDDVPVLVYDEVDSGVGGRLGEVLGQTLWQLGRTHQVLCVSHLPQLAAYADRHVRVRKEVRGGRSHVVAQSLDEAGHIGELASMLGAGRATRALAEGARELHAVAQAFKRGPLKW